MDSLNLQILVSHKYLGAQIAGSHIRYGYLTNTKVKFILVIIDLDVNGADVRNKQVKKYKTDGTSSSIKDDVVAKVLDPDPRGRERGLGFGATLSKGLRERTYN